jgi:hypothetical protein
MAFDVEVKPPDVLPLEIEIEYRGEASETEVRLLAEQYIYNLDIGGRFALAKLYDLYEALNLDTIEILTPDRDVQADTLQVAVGTIAVTKLEAL